MIIKVNYTVSDIYMSTSVSAVYIKVVYSGVSSGGGGTWGTITGTLSAQTDLQSALDAKVPYTGATGDVNLGEFELKAGQIEFDQTPTGTAGVGVMRWNDTDGTVDLGLKGGNVTLQVGQEQVLRVVNKTGASLLESQYRAVRIRLTSEGGSQGQRLAVVLAQGNNDPDSTTTIGIVTETIANNQEGFITTSGEVRGINTTGSLQSETWADGDIIYLSPTIPGGVTIVKPTAPNHMVVLGYVIYAHAINGKIFVKVDNGYELSELHDVYAPSPTDGQGIFWNTANSRYQNNTIAGVLGFTPVPTTRSLTINGTTQDLSADRTFTIATANIYNADGTLTSARTLTSGGFPLTFTGSNTAASLIARGLNLTHTLVASANSDVLVGLDINPTFTNGAFTGVTNFALRVTGGAKVSGLLTLGLGISGPATTYFDGPSTTGDLLIRYTNVELPKTTTTQLQSTCFRAIAGSTFTTGVGIEIAYALNTGYIYAIDRTTSSVKPLTLNAFGGNVIIGGTTDAGFKLDVNGTARVSGNFTQAGTNTANLGYITNTNTVGVATYTSPTLYAMVIGTVSNAGHTATFTKPNSAGTAIRVTGQNIDTTPNYFFVDYLGSAGFNFASGSLVVNASAQVQIDSTTKGFLPPRMTTTQRNAIASPATGLIVYNTTLNSKDFYDGATWRSDEDTITTNRQTASYSLVLADRGKLVEMNSASANTLTIPLNSSIAFPIGSKIDVTQYGAGATTITATGGVTIRSFTSFLKIAGQYAACTLVKIGTDEWYCYGNLIA